MLYTQSRTFAKTSSDCEYSNFINDKRQVLI